MRKPAGPDSSGHVAGRPGFFVPCLLIVWPFLAAAGAGTETHGIHEHVALPVDVELTLAEVIAFTVENDPGYGELKAREAQAEAWQDRGRSLTAAPPVASLRYQTDRWGDDVGLQEFESGIQLALWKWGERRSARNLGRAMGAESGAAAAALRWEAAGLLRRLLWDIARAEAELELVEESENVAARLAATIDRRYELGDVAERDVLLARSAALDAAARLAEARVRLTDAERTYRSVTGLDRRPSIDAESLSERSGIEADHPALMLVTSAVERARAARTLAGESGVSSPTLTIGPRRERGIATQPYEDSIGFNITVPFGGRSHIRTQVAAAGREVAAAQTRLRATVRELELDMHEAAHALAAARNNVKLAGERARLAGRGYEMGEIAYSRGEIGLVELLNLRGVFLDAARQAARFEIEVNQQTALYNQAVGVMP